MIHTTPAPSHHMLNIVLLEEGSTTELKSCDKKNNYHCIDTHPGNATPGTYGHADVQREGSLQREKTVEYICLYLLLL